MRLGFCYAMRASAPASHSRLSYGALIVSGVSAVPLPLALLATIST
jgi:hypothetical protein